MDGVERHREQLQRLSPHSAGAGCLYVKDLDEIDLSVLENIVIESYRNLTSDTYGLRAREGARPAPDDATG